MVARPSNFRPAYQGVGMAGGSKFIPLVPASYAVLVAGGLLWAWSPVAGVISAGVSLMAFVVAAFRLNRIEVYVHDNSVEVRRAFAAVETFAASDVVAIERAIVNMPRQRLRVAALRLRSGRLVKLWMTAPNGRILQRDNPEAERQVRVWQQFAERNGIACALTTGRQLR